MASQGGEPSELKLRTEELQYGSYGEVETATPFNDLVFS